VRIVLDLGRIGFFLLGGANQQGSRERYLRGY
jgi:hypothetical protein